MTYTRKVSDGGRQRIHLDLIGPDSGAARVDGVAVTDAITRPRA
jgi:hypothetical protein